MENSNKDKITRDILSNSKLEIKNPNFNTIVMNKILSETREPKRYFRSVYYVLIFLLVDTFIFILFKLFSINTIVSSSETNSLINDSIKNLIILKEVIFENSIIQYFILSTIVLLILNKITSFGLRYSQ